MSSCQQPLVLRVHRENDAWWIGVVKQDEALRSEGYRWRAHNGWTFASQACPDVNFYDRVLYLRGCNPEHDQATGQVPDSRQNRLQELAAAVAEFNQRKNVVRVSLDRGEFTII